MKYCLAGGGEAKKSEERKEDVPSGPIAESTRSQGESNKKAYIKGVKNQKTGGSKS